MSLQVDSSTTIDDDQDHRPELMKEFSNESASFGGGGGGGLCAILIDTPGTKIGVDNEYMARHHGPKHTLLNGIGFGFGSFCFIPFSFSLARLASSRFDD